ncbi:Polyol:NADP oxidoreductase [Citrobacter werkmanii]|nr:Polyol:NADP oxidoreductase [Citrobacter werkmanii]
MMKLRMLNGSHSFLAYLGYLAGYETIADTMANPEYRQAVRKLMLNEQAPTLSMPEGTDLSGYADLLLSRFTNPSLRHRTSQIAMDGSQKLPQRLLDQFVSIWQREPIIVIWFLALLDGCATFVVLTIKDKR